MVNAASSPQSITW